MTRPAWTQPLGRVLCAALYGLAAGVTVRVTRDGPAYALAGDSTVALAAELLAGLLLLAAGLTLLRPGSRFALLIVAAAVAWPAAEWGSPAAGVAFTAGLVVSTVWAPLLAAAALLGSDGRGLTRPARVLIAVAFTAEVGLAIASAAVFDPAGEGCAECPANRLLLAADPVTRHDLVRVGLLLSAAWTAAFVLLSVLRLARSTLSRRRLAGPVVVPAAAALALFGAGALHGLERGFRSNDAIDRTLWAGQVAAIVLVAAGVAAARLRARRRRAGLQRLVLDLGAVGTGSLSERLGKLLGDPSLVLLYARDDNEWVDARGRRASPAAGAGRQVTYVSSGGRRIAALVHRAGLLADPGHRRRDRDDGEARARARASAGCASGAARRPQGHLRPDRGARRRGAARARARPARWRTAAPGDGGGRSAARAPTRIGTTRSSTRSSNESSMGSTAPSPSCDASATGSSRPRSTRRDSPQRSSCSPRNSLAWYSGRCPRGRFPPAVESAAYHLVEQAAAMAPSGDVEVDADRRDARLVIELRAAIGFGPYRSASPTASARPAAPSTRTRAAPRGDAMRLVIADDETLLREGSRAS